MDFLKGLAMGGLTICVAFRQDQEIKLSTMDESTMSGSFDLGPGCDSRGCWRGATAPGGLSSCTRRTTCTIFELRSSICYGLGPLIAVSETV